MVGYALAMLAVAIAAAALFFFVRPRPLAVPVKDTRPAVHPPFENGNTTGYFGEMLTSIILARDGWKQLETHLPGGQGLDGVFVREKGRGFEVLLVETKTKQRGRDKYDPAQMTDAKILRQLQRFAELHPDGPALAGTILKALKQGSPYLRKESWNHDLDTAITLIRPLGRDGKPTSTGRVVEGAAHFRLMEALRLSSDWYVKRYQEKESDV